MPNSGLITTLLEFYFDENGEIKASQVRSRRRSRNRTSIYPPPVLGEVADVVPGLKASPHNSSAPNVGEMTGLTWFAASRVE